jgi:hypothetical protein
LSGRSRTQGRDVHRQKDQASRSRGPHTRAELIGPVAASRSFTTYDVVVDDTLERKNDLFQVECQNPFGEWSWIEITCLLITQSSTSSSGSVGETLVAAARVAAGVAGPTRERWSRERIAFELQRLDQGGAPVTERRAGARLAQACRNHFGSLGAACEAAEVRHAAPEPWTRARVLAELDRLGAGRRRVMYADL